MRRSTVAAVAALCLIGWPALLSAQNANPELVAQAKKEGRVTWYTTVSIPESTQAPG